MTPLCLYQTIHLHRGCARLLAEHVALLDEASRTLFGRGYTPTAGALSARLTAFAAAEAYPQGVSGFVRLELTPDGQELLFAAGVSLYDGYALRSVTPQAHLTTYDNPLDNLPTSAREAAALLARQYARQAGAQIAIQCSSGGMLLAADDAPLLAVCGNTVFTHTTICDPTHALVLRAVQAAGLELELEPLRRDQLRHCDELFYADHRGVTSIGRCDGQPFMPLIAQRVAEAMERLF